MKILRAGLMLLMLPLLLTACDTLGPLFGNYKAQLESIVGVTVAGVYTVEISKNGQLLMTQIWECTSDGTRLTGCHQTGSRTVSTDVVAPPRVPVQ